jgi:1-acyl-sn-glycerol-3-phosphate acyltransferase
MKQKESLIVYPGGAREICKKRGEEYILQWADRKGFVRMAMEYGYDIIPVAAVGAEEAFTIIKDADDILNSPFGKFLKFIGVAEHYFKNGELMPPVVRGIGGTFIPRPAKLYFSFGKRISTAKLKAKFEDEETQELVKKKVEDSLHKQFQELFEIRNHDTDRSKWRRLLNMKKPVVVRKGK